MKGIFSIFLFIIILIAVIVMVVINFMYRNFRRIREEIEERAYYNEKRKEKKEKNPFGQDYFKSSNKQNSRHRQSQYEFRTGSTGSQRKASATDEENTNTTTRTTTSGGVTIIDGREDKEKKIFKSDDGEYVEFEEVHD